MSGMPAASHIGNRVFSPFLPAHLPLLPWWNWFVTASPEAFAISECEHCGRFEFGVGSVSFYPFLEFVRDFSHDMHVDQCRHGRHQNPVCDFRLFVSHPLKRGHDRWPGFEQIL